MNYGYYPQQYGQAMQHTPEEDLPPFVEPEPAPEPEPAQPPRPAPPPVWKDALRLGMKIAAVAAIFALVITFVYGLHRNADPDMFPMVQNGDLVMFYRLDKDYAIGDLLLFDFQGERQIRRVVAKTGDTVDITEDGLMINGNPQLEPNVFEETFQYEEGVRFPLTVGQGEIFVLGDGREHATDSRIYGCVPAKETLGKVMTIARRRGI